MLIQRNKRWIIQTCCQINWRKSNAASTQINNRSENIVLITEPTVAGKISNLSRQNTQLFAHVGGGGQRELRVQAERGGRSGGEYGGVKGEESGGRRRISLSNDKSTGESSIQINRL